MFSKSINLKSFKINKNKKKIQNKLKILLSEKNQLIKSLSKVPSPHPKSITLLLFGTHSFIIVDIFMVILIQ